MTAQMTIRKTINPRVQSVIPQDNYLLRLTFTNGEIGNFDCRDLLHFGVFSELQSVSYFQQANVFNGTVVWPNGQDICPDTLYLTAMHKGEAS
jgi:Protein of unknown function (DUF2442)